MGRIHGRFIVLPHRPRAVSPPRWAIPGTAPHATAPTWTGARQPPRGSPRGPIAASSWPSRASGCTACPCGNRWHANGPAESRPAGARIATGPSTATERTVGSWDHIRTIPIDSPTVIISGGGGAASVAPDIDDQRVRSDLVGAEVVGAAARGTVDVVGDARGRGAAPVVRGFAHHVALGPSVSRRRARRPRRRPRHPPPRPG